MFLREHYDRIFRQAYRMLGNHSDAEDLTQEIVMSLPEKLKSFNGTSSLSTWLYRVVNNAAIDKKRQAARMKAGQESWLHFQEITMDALSQDDRGSDWLWDRVRKLDHTLSSTAFLLFDEELSQAQAAEILEISPGTVAWRVSEIKKKLQALAKTEEMV